MLCPLLIFVHIIFAISICNFGFVKSILHIILHGYLCIGVFVYDITLCIYYGDCGLYFGGGSYSCVYVSPPMSGYISLSL